MSQAMKDALRNELDEEDFQVLRYRRGDFLVESVDATGGAIRGWFRDGESAKDIVWKHEEVNGWPESVKVVI